MFTLLMLIVAFLVAAAITVVVTGIMSIMPGIIVIVALFVADYYIFNLVFKRKK